LSLKNKTIRSLY